MGTLHFLGHYSLHVPKTKHGVSFPGVEQKTNVKKRGKHEDKTQTAAATLSLFKLQMAFDKKKTLIFLEHGNNF